MTKLRALWEGLRSSLWLIPTLMLMMAILLAFGMLTLDEFLRARFSGRISLVYNGGAEGARALLSSVAGSMITVAGVAFSMTVVALTLASQQFGPRLLRNFMRDRGNQIALGTFIATFVYCLLILRAVRGSDTTGSIPHASVTGGLVLAVASLGVLIYFIHHVTNSIRASTIVAAVGRDLDDAIERLFPSHMGVAAPEGSELTTMTTIPDAWNCRSAFVTAHDTGYLQAIDSETLMRVAVTEDLVLDLPCRPGHFVQNGDVLLTGWPKERMTDAVIKKLNDAFILGDERTPLQDVEFCMNQLVEIAVRALSPGTNDPFTAIASIDRLGLALCKLACREFPLPYRYDQNACLRVITKPITFSGVTETAFNQIRQYGRGSVAVTIRLIETIGTIAERVHTDHARTALLNQAAMIERGSREALHEQWDRQAVHERFKEVIKKLSV